MCGDFLYYEAACNTNIANDDKNVIEQRTTVAIDASTGRDYF